MVAAEQTPEIDLNSLRFLLTGFRAADFLAAYNLIDVFAILAASA